MAVPLLPRHFVFIRARTSSHWLAKTGDSNFRRRLEARKRIFSSSSCLYPPVPDVLLLANSSSVDSTSTHAMAVVIRLDPMKTNASVFRRCSSVGL